MRSWLEQLKWYDKISWVFWIPFLAILFWANWLVGIFMTIILILMINEDRDKT